MLENCYDLIIDCLRGITSVFCQYMLHIIKQKLEGQLVIIYLSSPSSLLEKEATRKQLLLGAINNNKSTRKEGDDRAQASLSTAASCPAFPSAVFVAKELTHCRRNLNADLKTKKKTRGRG